MDSGWFAIVDGFQYKLQDRPEAHTLARTVLGSKEPGGGPESILVLTSDGQEINLLINSENIGSWAVFQVH